MPCPPKISDQPWSSDFSLWCDERNGSFRSDCVVSGVRNHIFTELNAVTGYFVRAAGDEEMVVDRERATVAPRMVARRGISFSAGGRIGWA